MSSLLSFYAYHTPHTKTVVTGAAEAISVPAGSDSISKIGEVPNVEAIKREMKSEIGSICTLESVGIVGVDAQVSAWHNVICVLVPLVPPATDTLDPVLEMAPVMNEYCETSIDKAVQDKE